MNTSPFLTKCHLFLNLAIQHSSTPLNPPLPQFHNSLYHCHLHRCTPHLIIVILFTTTSLSLKWPASNRLRTLLHTVLLKLPNLSIPLLHCLHWLKITEDIEYKLLSHSTSVTISWEVPVYCTPIHLPSNAPAIDWVELWRSVRVPAQQLPQSSLCYALSIRCWRPTTTCTSSRSISQRGSTWSDTRHWWRRWQHLSYLTIYITGSRISSVIESLYAICWSVLISRRHNG